MKTYNPKLTEDELKDTAIFQKKCLEAFAEITHPYGIEKTFEIFSIGIALVVSNAMTTLGIKNVDTYLRDMTDNIKRVHESVKKHSSYMVYRKGEKIEEGEFH